MQNERNMETIALVLAAVALAGLALTSVGLRGGRVVFGAHERGDSGSPYRHRPTPRSPSRGAHGASPRAPSGELGSADGGGSLARPGRRRASSGRDSSPPLDAPRWPSGAG